MSETRNATGPASSSGWPTRPSGVRLMKPASRSGSLRVDSVIAVAITPGAIALTRMPSGASSRASAWVSDFTPPLDGE